MKNKKIKCICKCGCGKEFYHWPSTLKRGRGKFYSKQCAYKWISENIRDKNHWSFGIQRAYGKDAPRWKGGKPHCIDCGKQLKYYGSLRCHHCNDIYEKRKNNPNWKEGITSLNTQIRASKQYEQWRLAIFIRDNFTCQDCGEKVYLNAHHIKEFFKILEENNITTLEQALQCKELWDINNGRTLCEDCHGKRHEAIGFFKGRIYQQQLDLFNLRRSK
jgi:5-methylcytosine-specific restriction endonuclease McrA